VKPLFLGLAGTELTPEERALFAEADPAGYILFARNIASPEQVRALTAELKALSGRERLPILIDQEGGRVARLRPPHWPEFPAGRRFGLAYEKAPVTGIEAARANARALAAMLLDLGINVDCLPVLDVPAPGAHDIIGDRAYGGEPEIVTALGDATLRGLREGGVVGVIKHMPGHGRATADSHEALPVVEASREALERDFAPFRALKDAPMAMTAHVTYTALDPNACASLSPLVIGDLIRGEFGFDGLLMSDDLGMKAVGGPVAERARGALSAGCDIALHCSGVLADNAALCASAPEIGEAALRRLERAMAWPEPQATGDVAVHAERRDRLLGAAA
jgi:beta-N-acetylhexosaminidase